LSKYKSVLKRKVVEDYCQWEQTQRLENERLSDNVLYNSIKHYEVKIERQEYMDKGNGTESFRTQYVSLLAVFFSIIPTVTMMMFENIVSTFESLEKELKDIDDKMEYIDMCNDAYMFGYSFVVEWIFYILVFVILALCIMEIFRVWSRKQESWEISYNKDVLRLLRDEEVRRKNEQ